MATIEARPRSHGPPNLLSGVLASFEAQYHGRVSNDEEVASRIPVLKFCQTGPWLPTRLQKAHANSTQRRHIRCRKEIACELSESLAKENASSNKEPQTYNASVWRRVLQSMFGDWKRNERKRV
jgi:hypothetical protein